MSYYFSKKKLSNNEYNDLINSNSLEEIKNKINKLLVDDNEDSLNSNFSFVRSLSLNEYDKYIFNNTFDGTITKNDDNVFHHFTNQSSYDTFFTYTDNVPFTPYAGKPITLFPSTRIYLKNDGTKCRYAKIYNENSYTLFNNYTLTIDNTSSNISIIGSNNTPRTYEIFSSDDNQAAVVYNYSSQYVEGFKLSLTKSNTKSNITMTAIAWNRAAVGTYTLTINQCGCFRPVIQYIDNHKANNIFL